MKKLVVMLAGLLLLVTGVLAAGHAEHVYLVAKDPTTWEVVDSVWGKVMYQDDKFVFNGHGLPEGDFVLINYARDGTEWPPTIQCLGEGTAKGKGGQVHIMGPMIDLMYDTTPGTGSTDGYKLWLVPSASADCDAGELVGWDAGSYLFEAELI